MPRVKNLFLPLELDFDQDEKVLRLNRYGAQARAVRDLLVSAWRYCKRNTSDGHVPADAIGVLAYPDSVKNGLRDADRLVECGLAERTPDGYFFPGYLKRNPSKAQLAEEAARKAEAGKKGGLASGLVRKNEAEVKQGASEVRSQTTDNRQQTSDNNEQQLLGERPETLRVVPATDLSKEPTCIKHPDGNPKNEPCAGCARIRERAERAMSRDAERAARENEEAARLCPRCEGGGKILTADKIPTGRRCFPHLPPVKAGDAS